MKLARLVECRDPSASCLSAIRSRFRWGVVRPLAALGATRACSASAGSESSGGPDDPVHAFPGLGVGLGREDPLQVLGRVGSGFLAFADVVEEIDPLDEFHREEPVITVGDRHS